MASPNQNTKRFNKKNKIIIAALALVAVLFVSFWVTQKTSFWPSHSVKPDVALMQPITGYYLTFQGNTTKIFVVSATVTSGYYPYSTRTAFGSKSGSSPVVEKGEPCVIINVTVRYDYSAMFPAPDPNPKSPTTAFVFLTAKIFHGDKQINTTDLTNVELPPDAWSFTSLQGGQTRIISIFLATSSKNSITALEIVPKAVGGIPMA